MADVRVICAIGKRGQLGLKGKLPWEGNRGAEYKADVERFFALTRGHVLIAGPKTIGSFPPWAFAQMTLAEIHIADEPREVLARYRGRVVFNRGTAKNSQIRWITLSRGAIRAHVERWTRSANEVVASPVAKELSIFRGFEKELAVHWP